VNRKAQVFEASLRRELSEVTLRAALDEPGRLRWIRDQLENYFDRWTAFLALGPRGSRSAFTGDLFTMVEVACRVYEHEVDKTHSRWRGEAWTGFSEAFRHLCETGDVSLFPGVRERLVAVADDVKQRKNDSEYDPKR
jgi:hypothetical protein